MFEIAPPTSGSADALSNQAVLTRLQSMQRGGRTMFGLNMLGVSLGLNTGSPQEITFRNGFNGYSGAVDAHISTQYLACTKISDGFTLLCADVRIFSVE